MMKRDGRFFHIDFGHFLGHFKKVLGFDREKAPFVFTPQYAAVLGGKGSASYVEFEETCCKALHILRRHADLFVNLLAMMLPVGLEELASPDDVRYVLRMLMLDRSDDEVSAHFKSLIDASLSTKRQQVSDVVHIIWN